MKTEMLANSGGYALSELAQPREVLALDRSRPADAERKRNLSAIGKLAQKEAKMPQVHNARLHENGIGAAKFADQANGAELAQATLQPWLRDHIRTEVGQRLYLTPVWRDPVIISNRSRVIGTPYDETWSLGGGFAFGAEHDGHVTSFGINGESNAGVGFYISSPVRASAVITPAGNYEWNWTAFTNAPGVRSRGGLGATVYKSGDSNPVYNRTAELWRVAGVSQFTGKQGAGAISGAATPPAPGTFGPVPIAPIIIDLAANTRYLVWFTLWQINVTQENDGFLSFISFKMPFVTLELGAPFVGPH